MEVRVKVERRRMAGNCFIECICDAMPHIRGHIDILHMFRYSWDTQRLGL